MTRSTSHTTSPRHTTSACNAPSWLVVLAACASIAMTLCSFGRCSIESQQQGRMPSPHSFPPHAHHAGTSHAEASPDDRQRLDCRLPVQGYPFGPAAHGADCAGSEPCLASRVTPVRFRPAPLKDRQGTAATPSGDAVLAALPVAHWKVAPDYPRRKLSRDRLTRRGEVSPGGVRLPVLAALPRPHPLALMASELHGIYCQCLCCHDERSRRLALLAFLAEGC